MKHSGSPFALATVTDRNRSARSSEPVEGGGLVGFVFGVVVGTTVGLASWTFAHLQPWYALGLGIIVGTVGYFFGDRFWYWAAEKIKWFY